MQDIAQDITDIKVFIDGSGMNDNIRANVILYRNDRRKTSLCYKLGLISHHTVYKGEATGILLATTLIAKEVFAHSAIIYVDSRALILTSLLTTSSPDHYLIDAFHVTICNICKKTPRLSIQIKWVPAHKGVKGNKAADHLVKSTITNSSSSPTKLPILLLTALPHSRSAVKQNMHSRRHTVFIDPIPMLPPYETYGPPFPFQQLCQSHLLLTQKIGQHYHPAQNRPHPSSQVPILHW